MAAYILISVLFAAGAVANFFGEPVNVTEGTACLTISLAMLGMLAWVWTSHRRAEDTLRWLIANKDRLSDEADFFNDAPVFDKTISKKSKLSSFRVVTSAFLFTSVDELGLEFRTGIWAGLFATAWTLIFGWWGLPWGPVRTIQALIHNCTGGKRISAAGAIISAESGWNFETGKRRRP